MSDGPSATLQMDRRWRRAARRAENDASDVEEIRAAIEAALAAQWREGVPSGLVAALTRCHPRFTAKMERLVMELFGHRARYRFPRLWNTKGETLREAVSMAVDATGWDDTRSCWQSQRHVSVDRKRRQCGICAACLLRRLSIHCAGLREPPETYVWEDLRSSEFKEGASRSFPDSKITFALKRHGVAGTRHLADLAALDESATQSDTLRRSAIFIGQALGFSRIKTESGQRPLLLQHKSEWHDFLRSLGPDSFVATWAEAPL
ncbi:MAG TPA: 7-cyano-7-deazaguanine synthase [Acetobacteraceae bacterium]|nr:7-cyano-7-deazaguanine synthase [Acetobacteraceae bacterium]